MTRAAYCFLVIPCACLLALLTNSCGGPDEGARETPGATADEPPLPELPVSKRIIGKWRMTKEEPADGKGGFFEQERRLLELRADRTYHVENYVSAFDDSWKLDGQVLTFSRKNGDTKRVEVERVDGESLVLIEDLPEIYLRDGPPRRVRNTYRRVSENELGPMLGKKVVTSAPVAGSYAASYEYRMDKFPTMEINVSRKISGRARLELKADGSVDGCIGVAGDRHFSESKYSSRDGKHHTRDEDDYWLAGVQGKWEPKKDKALLRISRYWRDSCDTSNGEGEIMGALELECVALIDEIAINPADTERSGPFTLQVEPRGHISPDTGRPWLLLGAAPGLKVESVDDRHADNPVVTFSKGEIDFVQRRYFKPKPRPEP
ncbi:MAG: lipocalin family protein [Deltaproteobacteria bacterium]|nr:lipocalin family protein [Deltaproteobacteria bacterium]